MEDSYLYLLKSALKNAIWAFQGDMSELLKMVDYSDLFVRSNRAMNNFTKFLWSFERVHIYIGKIIEFNPYKLSEIHLFIFKGLNAQEF